MDANMVDYTKAFVLCAAGLAMAIGSVGPSLAQGMIGRSACESIAKNPDSNAKIRMAMIISMGFVETCAIYALIIGVIIIGKVS